MSFTLPDLPYPYDALAPYMSRETLEYHHDKHHLAYVNNGNNLLKGTEWEGKSLEEIKAALPDAPAPGARAAAPPAAGRGPAPGFVDAVYAELTKKKTT